MISRIKSAPHPVFAALKFEFARSNEPVTLSILSGYDEHGNTILFLNWLPKKEQVKKNTKQTFQYFALLRLRTEKA